MTLDGLTTTTDNGTNEPSTLNLPISYFQNCTVATLIFLFHFHFQISTMTPPPSNHTRNNSNKLSQRSKTGAAANSTPVYHPSIFRYTCRGHLSLDSRQKYAPGVCRGLQSQLQHVEHWQLASADEAVQVFQQKSALGDHAAEDDATNGSDSDAATAQAVQAIYLSNVLVYPLKSTPTNTPTATNDDEGDNNDKDKGTEAPPTSTETNNSNDESSQPTSNTEEWGCYGSTEVDLLVLREQGQDQEHIAAVAPYCAPGMTVRDVTTPTLGKDRTSTIRLGFVEILYQSSIEDMQAEEKEHASMPSSESSPDSKNKLAKRPSNSEKETAGSIFAKFTQSSANLWKHMTWNAKLIAHATQDEFPTRTYQASQRVLQESTRTFDRTVTLMKKVMFWDWSLSDYDDNDGDSKKR
jgi:hypothetical protein